ncbi:hypothetical protein N0V90_008607 [Kalmusia sp. IMI 367209]|nr:hypothetical protein N0V90_008607 [Kalmusia sp. IMI 367209]
MAAQPYSHKPLQDSTSIRALRHIDHATGLRFQMTEIDLDDASALPYRCLSYTWGNPLDCEADQKALDEWHDRHQIFLCEETDLGKPCWTSFSVTTNLYEFLREFSSAPAIDTPWIWIDAICINQADFKERTAQVGLMRRIYRSCTEVIIWLGREGEETRFILVRGLKPYLRGSAQINFVSYSSMSIAWRQKSQPICPKTLGTIANILIKTDMMSHASTLSQATYVDLNNSYNADASFRGRSSLSNSLVSRGFPEPDEKTFKFLTAFLRRSWFHRVWTIQECVLPSKGKVWYGTFRVNEMEKFSSIGIVSILYYNKKVFIDKYTWAGAVAANYLRDFLFYPQAGRARRFLSNGILESLRFCLEFSRGKTCSALHDHIYAILGLQDDLRIEADYKVPVKELYSKIALHPSLRPILFDNAGLGLSRRISDLPSWIPDWSLELDPIPWPHFHGLHRYNSGNFYREDLSILHPSENVISVTGFREDEVTLLGGIGWEAEESLIESFETLNWACGGSHAILNAEKVVERFWRTLIINRQNGGGTVEEPSSAEYGPLFRDFVLDRLSSYLFRRSSQDEALEVTRSTLELLLQHDQIAARLLPTWQEIEEMANNRKHDVISSPLRNNYSTALIGTLPGRRFFVTSKGRMGIATNMIERGDAIMIVKGSEYPLVMRKGSEGRWKLLGQAYVEDIMYGEALEGNAIGNIEIE